VAPGFTRDEIRRIFIPQPGAALDGWVLYHRRTPDRDEIRVDVVDLFAHRHDRPDLAVQIGDRMIDLRTPQPDPLPLVDLSADSVTVAVPRSGDGLPPVVVTHHGRRRRPRRSRGHRERPRRVRQLRHPGPQRPVRHRR
jgi:hypothetical protein